MLVVVDDAEYADPVSLHALSALVRHHRDLPLLVLLGAAQRTPPLADLAADERRLEGLDAPAVAELTSLRGRVLHPAMVEGLTRHTRGNPRDVLALLDELPASVWSRPDSALPAPAHIVAEVRGQIERCGPSSRALVEALAILGDDESLDAAVHLAELDDPLGAIDGAAAAGLLAAPPEYQPRLRNPLTRAAVVDLMGVRAASAAHRRAADIINDPVRRLRHRVAATPLPDAELADDVAPTGRFRRTTNERGRGRRERPLPPLEG